MGRVRRSAPPDERFDQNLRRAANGCLLWTGAVGSHGYGNFWDGERYICAYQYAWERATGQCAQEGRSGPVVRHTCDTPLCCEPSHLVRSSHGENHADCREKGRGPQYRRSLSAQQEERVRERYAGGESQQSIADSVGVNQKTVSRIVRGRQHA